MVGLRVRCVATTAQGCEIACGAAIFGVVRVASRSRSHCDGSASRGGGQIAGSTGGGGPDLQIRRGR